MSKFQDDCIARLNEQVKQDQIIIKKLSDQRDELVKILEDCHVMLDTLAADAKEDGFQCRADNAAQLAMEIRTLLQKARTS